MDDITLHRKQGKTPQLPRDPKRLPVQIAGGSARLQVASWCRAPVDLRGCRSRYGRQLVQIAGGFARLLSRYGRQLVQVAELTALSSISLSIAGYRGIRSTARDPNFAGLRSRSGRFEQWGGVRGPLVSLNEKARTMAGLIVGAMVLGIRRALVQRIRGIVGLVPQRRVLAPLGRCRCRSK